MLKSFEYFPTCIYRDEKPEWVDIILNKTEKYFLDVSKENQLCQTCDMSLDDALFFFKEYILKNCHEILINQGYNMDLYSLRVSSMWGQEIKPNSFGTDDHMHSNTQITGWIFLKTSIGGSYPIFYDPRINKQMIELRHAASDYITNASSSVHFNNVVPGTILLSNSWIKHQLTYNYSDEINKTLHFMVSL